MEGYQVYPFVFTGFSFCQLKMQAMLPRQDEACKAYLDSDVQVSSTRRTSMLKRRRRGAAPPRSRTHGQLLVPHWKLSKRRGPRSHKSVMLLDKPLSGTFSIYSGSYSYLCQQCFTRRGGPVRGGCLALAGGEFSVASMWLIRCLSHCHHG